MLGRRFQGGGKEDKKELLYKTLKEECLQKKGVSKDVQEVKGALLCGLRMPLEP